MIINSETNKVIRLLLEGTLNDPQNNQPLQIEQVNRVDTIIRGGEDPIKGSIDKMIDDKNNVLQNQSNEEIQKLINNA